MDCERGDGCTEIIDGCVCCIEACKDRIMRFQRNIILLSRMETLSCSRSGTSLSTSLYSSSFVTVERLIFYWGFANSCGQILYGFLRTYTPFNVYDGKSILTRCLVIQYGQIHSLDHM